MPTSILIELLLSGGMRYECTHISRSFVTSAIRREMVTRMKYLCAVKPLDRDTSRQSRMRT